MVDIGYSSTITQGEEYKIFCNKIQMLSSIQGSLSYILMSILAVHREVVNSYAGEYTFIILYVNMVYGMCITLYTRPTFQKIYKFHRLTFSLLGSLMFNQASVVFFQWIEVQLPESPWFRTLIGFIGGRLMIYYFVTYLYLVDNSIGIIHFQRIM